jgi:hypothetical protein
MSSIPTNKEIFDNAGILYSRAYFDFATGGFVLIHRGHNRGESFTSELLVAKAFAHNGSMVKLLDESDAIEGKRPDADIDGQIWDFKRLTRKTQSIDRRVQEGYTNARRQGAIGVAYYVDRPDIDIEQINAGISQAVYWDRKKCIRSLAIVFKNKLVQLTFEEWENGQVFREF